MSKYDMFGPVDAALRGHLTPEILVIEAVLLGLVVVNMVARAVAHRQHVSQVDDGGADAISRHPVHVAANLSLVLASFYFLTVHQHAGMVASAIAITILLTDFFEFESRKVEARRDIAIERPKAAISATFLALIYVGYVTFFSGPVAQFF